ncbi:MAG: inorganic phosphate transporter, partial [Candidatus Gracilibacteria bacterium]|nr:inorganic phosphate transporter [Candidatus Gracilibacteria bacterium]
MKLNFDYFTKRTSFKYELTAAIVLGLITWIYFFQGGNDSILLLFACILGLYMAMNIGANDVANNMGPAVGSKALTLGGAILVAAIFEASGAIIAGGDVVNTIKGGIIDSTMITDVNILIYIMMATLLGAAVWINIATYIKAPVSATHSVMGGLLGAGMTASAYMYITNNNDWGLS